MMREISLAFQFRLIKIAWKVIKVIFAIFSLTKKTTATKTQRHSDGNSVWRAAVSMQTESPIISFALSLCFPSIDLTIYQYTCLPPHAALSPHPHLPPIFQSFFHLFLNSAPFYFTELQLLSLPFSFTHSRMWNVSHGFLLAYRSTSTTNKQRRDTQRAKWTKTTHYTLNMRWSERASTRAVKIGAHTQTKTDKEVNSISRMQ